ncbi:hypothetical protein A1C62_RS02195 [Acinetobacter baumannii]|nr:hypothetical protein [Acinetobacter baumannii]
MFTPKENPALGGAFNYTSTTSIFLTPGISVGPDMPIILNRSVNPSE